MSPICHLASKRVIFRLEKSFIGKFVGQGVNRTLNTKIFSSTVCVALAYRLSISTVHPIVAVRTSHRIAVVLKCGGRQQLSALAVSIASGLNRRVEMARALLTYDGPRRCGKDPPAIL